MATYAVGDIHGCYAAFQRLLGAINFCPANDRLWCVGDVVNRGPDSLATLRWLYNNAERVTITLGNHDLHLLAVAAGARKPSKNDTLDDILAADDRDELLGWLRQQPLAHFQNDWLMIHAGALPQWSCADTLALAAEASAVIRGEQWRDFCHAMYGDTPSEWRDDLRGDDRRRVIINALTRMRICSLAGVMRMGYTGALADIPAGYGAWFDAPGRKTADTRIICGHWSTIGVLRRANVCALDSGCLWGGKLTALRLEDDRLFQIDSDVALPHP